MKFPFSSGCAGKIAAGMLILTMSAASAETFMTVNGIDVDEAVVEMYLASRAQGPLSQEVRDLLIEELSDLYLLSMDANDTQLNDMRVVAQLELQKRVLLAQLVASDFLQNNRATDEEILAEYGRRLESAPPHEFKARHILVETQSGATDLISQLDGGADFQELAGEHSLDSSGTQGGDLGWIRPGDPIVQPFAEALELLEDGTYTAAPVQTQFGWHVILREESRLSAPPTLESEREQIQRDLEQEKLRKYIEQLRTANTE